MGKAEFKGPKRHPGSKPGNRRNYRNCRNRLSISLLPDHIFVSKSVDSIKVNRFACKTLISLQARKTEINSRIWEAVMSFRDLCLLFPKRKRRFFIDFNSCTVSSMAGCDFLTLNFIRMYHIIFALLWAMACPNFSGSTISNNNGQVTTMNDDTGGETGTIPPKPITPNNP